jgi:hypothetical protein
MISSLLLMLFEDGSVNLPFRTLSGFFMVITFIGILHQEIRPE